MVAGEGRSKEGGDGGASGRAPLVSGRREEEKGGDDRRVTQPNKYLGVTWADRPPLQSGPSGGRVLHRPTELQMLTAEAITSRNLDLSEELASCLQYVTV